MGERRAHTARPRRRPAARSCWVRLLPDPFDGDDAVDRREVVEDDLRWGAADDELSRVAEGTAGGLEGAHRDVTSEEDFSDVEFGEASLLHAVLRVVDEEDGLRA